MAIPKLPQRGWLPVRMLLVLALGLSGGVACSGMTDVPDFLRMVPGVDVARIDANAWAVFSAS